MPGANVRVTPGFPFFEQTSFFFFPDIRAAFPGLRKVRSAAPRKRISLSSKEEAALKPPEYEALFFLDRARTILGVPWAIKELPLSRLDDFLLPFSRE